MWLRGWEVLLVVRGDVWFYWPMVYLRFRPGRPPSSLPSLLLLVFPAGMLPEIGPVTLSCTGATGQVWLSHVTLRSNSVQ